MFENRFLLRKFDRGLLTLFALLVFLPLTGHAGYLYLLNDDSTGNRIYGFRVNESTGELTALSGFPVNAAVGGINNIVSERMLVDLQNHRLYVVNEGSDSVSAYSIDSATGAIAPLPFSPIALGTGVWNTIAVHPSGSPLIVANNATNGLAHSFIITPTTATPALGSPFTVSGAAGFSSEFSVDGNYYYVGGNIGMTIAGFGVDPSTGVLTPLAGTPFNAGATGPLAYATDSSGRFFTVDGVAPFGLRVFTSSGGVLTPVTGSPFASGLTQRRFGIMHPAGFYMVAGNTGNNVGVYQISGSGPTTTVAPAAGSPFATGATTANVLALNSIGSYLFVGNRISRNVTTFAVNPSTGVLSGQTNQPGNTLGTVGAINGIGYLPDALAANAPIGGRITDAAGIGIAKVTVRLVSMDGMTRISTVTNPFGYFNFPAVLTGTTYTLTPIRKAYTFSPTSIVRNHTGDATDVNFIGQPD